MQIVSKSATGQIATNDDILDGVPSGRRGWRRGGDLVMDTAITRTRYPWNKGILVCQKRPLQPKNVWSIRVRLEMSGATRELALFNLAINSKLRACDLVRLRVEDLWSGSSIRDRATIIQRKRSGPCSLRLPTCGRPSPTPSSSSNLTNAGIASRPLGMILCDGKLL